MENVFEKMANKYDSEKTMELSNIIVKEIKPALEHSKSKSLLDYGAGTGLVSLELVDLVNSILLIDSSQKMLKIAEEKIAFRKISNSKTMYADFTEQIPNIKTNIIIMSLVLLHIPDTKEILQALFSILNNDGELIIVDFDKNDQVNHPKIHNGFSHEDLKNKLSEIGFKSINIKTF